MANPVERDTITPLYVNPPGNGKKWGKVKVINEPWTIANGYFIMPHVLPYVKPGQSYDVEYEIRDFQGANMRVISKATPASEASAQTAGNGAALALNKTPPPKTWQPQQKSLQEQAIIAACGIVNHAVAAGILVLDEESITEAFNAALNGFYNSKAALPNHGQVPKAQPPAQSATKKPTAAEEMDDVIPF